VADSVSGLTSIILFSELMWDINSMIRAMLLTSDGFIKTLNFVMASETLPSGIRSDKLFQYAFILPFLTGA
jgi:hypothetical protein